MQLQQHSISRFIAALLVLSTQAMAEDFPGTGRVQMLNYPDCIELTNDVGTRAVLCHHVGGRVIEYSQDRADALYLDPREREWNPSAPPENPTASAGRFDIGPEYLVPERKILWSGKWSAEITGPRSARLTSAHDPATGVQLVRDFQLAADSSQLSCTQTIRNISDETKNWCHWSRTFAVHGGIAIVPLTPETSKFPTGYIMMHGRNMMNIVPEDPNIQVRGRFLEVVAPPAQPKLGMDSHAGWLAYQMPNDLVFVKYFTADPNRVYNEVAGLTISVWYPESDQIPACELEPIGPRESLAPGEEASFTEHWQLIANPFPADGKQLDLDALGKRIESMRPPILSKK